MQRNGKKDRRDHHSKWEASNPLRYSGNNGWGRNGNGNPRKGTRLEAKAEMRELIAE